MLIFTGVKIFTIFASEHSIENIDVFSKIFLLHGELVSVQLQIYFASMSISRRSLYLTNSHSKDRKAISTIGMGLHRWKDCIQSLVIQRDEMDFSSSNLFSAEEQNGETETRRRA